MKLGWMGLAGVALALAVACFPKESEEPSDTEMSWKASGRDGAVAAGDSRAVAAGIEILAEGGNAADAAVAVILALSVTDYGDYCIGGEVPFLIYDARREAVEVLSGQGAAPRLATLEHFREIGGIPERGHPGNLQSAAVPAVIDLCVTALERYGTRTFAQAARPVLEILDAGGDSWHPKLAGTLRRLIEAESQTEGGRIEGLRAVSDRFYRGDIAEELDAWYREHGGLLRKEDLAAHRTRVEEPVTIDYRGYAVCKAGPWTQGPYLSQTLRLLEGYDLRQMGHLSADYIHVVAEAMKLALADRDRYYGDPRFVEVPLAGLLSDQYTLLRRPLIDLRKASLEVRPGDPYGMRPVQAPRKQAPRSVGESRDTTTCVVADRWGNLVAATPSGWGSQVDEGGGTGVTHGTRLVSLNTWEGHPNVVAPGKRPRITLTPTIVLKEGKPVIAISVAGGDHQDQVSLQLLLDAVEFGMKPDRAVTVPRFATAHHTGSFSQPPPRLGSLSLHEDADKAVAEELRRRGHRLEFVQRVASPVMLQVGPEKGTFLVAGDPGAGRHAAALDSGE